VSSDLNRALQAQLLEQLGLEPYEEELSDEELDELQSDLRELVADGPEPPLDEAPVYSWTGTSGRISDYSDRESRKVQIFHPEDRAGFPGQEWHLRGEELDEEGTLGTSGEPRREGYLYEPDTPPHHRHDPRDRP
jgi:hypothetical protein